MVEIEGLVDLIFAILILRFEVLADFSVTVHRTYGGLLAGEGQKKT